MRAGAGEIDAAITAGGDDHLSGAEPVNRTVVEIPCHDAAHHAFVDDQVEREIFDEEIHLVFYALAVESMQDCMTGAVGGGSRALSDSLAVMPCHAHEGALGG